MVVERRRKQIVLGHEMMSDQPGCNPCSECDRAYCCPVDAFTTTNYWAFSRNYDLDESRDADYAAFSQKVRDQDKPIIESQRPQLVPPIPARIALPLAGPDAPLLEYLRWLEELGITVAP